MKITSRFLTCIFLVFLSHNLLFSQDLSGHWEGELPQNDKSFSFSMELDITQDGESITGTSKYTIPSNGDFVVEKFEGIIKGNLIEINEYEVVDSRLESGFFSGWCVKSMKGELIIDFEKREMVIRGTWSSSRVWFPSSGQISYGSCAPGTFIVKKDLRHAPCEAEMTGNLYPAIPLQIHKDYALDENYRLFEAFEINKFHSECKRGSLSTDRCVSTYLHYRKKMFTYYMTEEGELVTGYWHLEYREDDETMGTLFAPGHTQYRDDRSEFEGETYTGSTYAVPVDQFYCISYLDENTAERILQEQEAIDPEEFRRSGNLFIRIDR